MAYPAKLLAPGESIVYELKPHWRGLIVPFIAFILEVFILTLLLVRFSDSAVVRWIVLVAFVFFVVLWSLVPFLRWLTTQYVFTDRRIITRSGLLTKQGRDMPLAKTNNVSFSQGLLGRMLNFGNLDIDSANADGSLIIRDVPDVENIQRDVYRLQEEDDARRRRGGS
ncbi:MAG: PH domain-containing protein [Candidatus Nanopelagicales bacterium]|nr:PH domain-containing protein [Candidatus Nanopelagicales bacterium]